MGIPPKCKYNDSRTNAKVKIDASKIKTWKDYEKWVEKVAKGEDVSRSEAEGIVDAAILMAGRRPLDLK